MGRAARGLWTLVSRAAADAAGLHVCRRCLRRGRRDRGLHQRRADCQIRSGGAGGFETRNTALRRDCPARAEARFRSGIAGGAATAARQDRHLRDARGQFARRRWRRRIVARCGGALAVGEDREAVRQLARWQAQPGPPFQRGFLVGLVGGRGAGAAFARAGRSGSSALPTVAIWIRWLTAAAGRVASSNCSSPRPIACRRFDEILNVFTSTSRITSARLWLSVRLFSRLPLEPVWATIRNLYVSSVGLLSTSEMRPSDR